MNKIQFEIGKKYLGGAGGISCYLVEKRTRCFIWVRYMAHGYREINNSVLKKYKIDNISNKAEVCSTIYLWATELFSESALKDALEDYEFYLNS